MRCEFCGRTEEGNLSKQAMRLSIDKVEPPGRTLCSQCVISICGLFNDTRFRVCETCGGTGAGKMYKCDDCLGLSVRFKRLSSLELLADVLEEEPS